MTTANIMPTQFVPPTPSGNANEGHNLQYVTAPADQLPYLSFNKFRAGGSVHRVRLVVLSEEEVDTSGVAEDIPEVKVRMMLIVWMLPC